MRTEKIANILTVYEITIANNNNTITKCDFTFYKMWHSDSVSRGHSSCFFLENFKSHKEFFSNLLKIKG